MTIDPVTWPIGIIPVACFLYGVVQLVGVSLMGKEPTQNTTGAFMGFVPGVIVIIAWLVNYRTASDHAFSKFLILSLVGAVIFMSLRFQLIIQNSEFGKKIDSDMKALPRAKLRKNLSKAIFIFCALCIVFRLAEFRLKNPQPCTRIMCEAGTIFLGSQYSSFGFLWLFSLFTSLFLAGIFVTLSALARSKKDK